jgi:hypothetical protein
MVRRKFPTNKLILDSCTQDNHNFYSRYIVTHRSTHLYRNNLSVPQFCEFTLRVKNQEVSFKYYITIWQEPLLIVTYAVIIRNKFIIL